MLQHSSDMTAAQFLYMKKCISYSYEKWIQPQHQHGFVELDTTNAGETHPPQEISTLGQAGTTAMERVRARAWGTRLHTCLFKRSRHT